MATTEINEQGDDRSSSTEVEAQQRPRRGGKGGHHRREEPTSLAELQACPLAVTCFQYMSCFQFCERLAQIQHHRELARLFVLRLHDGQVNIAGVNFVFSPEMISEATGIPNVGEVWPKRKWLDFVYFEPYVRPAFVHHLSGNFPFRFLREEYAPIMRIIMHYFTCEGKVFTSLCLSHSPVDALYPSEDDEHPGLLLPGYSEDGVRVSEAVPSSEAQELVSSWSHPAGCFPSAEPVGHFLGKFYLP